MSTKQCSMPAAGINFSKEETVAQVHASHMPTAARAAAKTLAQGAGRRTTVAWTRWRIVAMPVEYAARQENK